MGLCFSDLWISIYKLVRLNRSCLFFFGKLMITWPGKFSQFRIRVPLEPCSIWDLLLCFMVLHQKLLVVFRQLMWDGNTSQNLDDMTFLFSVVVQVWNFNEACLLVYWKGQNWQSPLFFYGALKCNCLGQTTFST